MFELLEVGEDDDPLANHDLDDLDVDGDPAHRTALMRFDLSPLPPGARLQIVELRLMPSSGVEQTGAEFGLYEVLVPWRASEASWFVGQQGQSWSSPGLASGTDLGVAPLGVLTGGGGAGISVRWTDAGVVAAQRWLDQPTTNHGFAFRNYSANDGIRLRHCDTANAQNRPHLVVVYATDAGAQTSQLANGGGYTGCQDTYVSLGPPLDGGSADTLGLSAAPGSPDDAESFLISFDLGALPRGASVQAAVLRLTLEDVSTDNLQAFEVLRPWSESEATWTHSQLQLPWSVPGARGATDVGAVLLGQVSLRDAGVALLPFNDAGVALFQQWLQGARPNHGLLMRTNGTSQAIFSDSEDLQLPARPQLVLTLLLPDGGPEDAGADAGASDGGTGDAGDADADAGDSGVVTSDGGAESPDGGGHDRGVASDAGLPGGDPVAGVSLAVGCDCGSAASGAIEALAFLVIAFSLRFAGRRALRAQHSGDLADRSRPSR